MWYQRQYFCLKRPHFQSVFYCLGNVFLEDGFQMAKPRSYWLVGSCYRLQGSAQVPSVSHAAHVVCSNPVSQIRLPDP